ncbi:sodium-dependent multivitamin transporter-like [Ruditapes philippinarum]|uniref:sodium-dependent multivitamin transporter-like n=1 Tax=Ruditapes philippinarum TaxID=129788 RepID=UPI00295B230E|nr:sodium-dependent multivitamin transporter-like [Ruditapes philippinarum]
MGDEYSFQTGEKRELGILDYVLFSLLFVASALIGFYHAYKDRKNTNIEDFHLGGKKMHPIPVSLSLAATFMSALTIIGTPAEVYTFGTMFYWIVCGMFIATIGTAHVFLPVFYRTNKISCFVYLELRFGTLVRVFACVLFLLQTLLYMGFVLYAPSLAFQAVTGLSLWGSLIGVASVCTLYTMLGGMKTVLWTDSLQIVVMIIGLLALLIEGTSATGGITKAWEIAKEHGRIEFGNVSPDPRTRHTVWSVGIGGGIFWSYLYGINQAQVQRECSLPTLRKSQMAVWLNFPALVLINTLVCLIGVVMFAFYNTCDPIKYGLVSKNDQLVPLMVLDVLGNIPGLSGIFMACVFSGSLSSISSGLSAMSAVLLEDFIKRFCTKSLTRRKELILTKFIIIIIGFTMFGISILISQAGGMIIQLSYTLYSLISGPLLGCFVGGMLFPWTNKYGAVCGLATSLTIMCWLGFGAVFDGPPGTLPLPVHTDGCYRTNSSLLTTTSISNMQTSAILHNVTTPTTVENEVEPLVYDFYRISYQWYTGLGMLINLITSLIVSIFTGRTNRATLNDTLISPLFFKLSSCLPRSKRTKGTIKLNGNTQSKKESVEYIENENNGYVKENAF